MAAHRGSPPEDYLELEGCDVDGLFYDPYFFRLMGDHWRLCDWSCECEHFGTWWN